MTGGEWLLVFMAGWTGFFLVLWLIATGAAAAVRFVARIRKRGKREH